MKKLSTDNPFFDFMGNVGDWIILNVLFVVTSLPIVTIGMSMTAMYKIAMRRMRKESAYVIREYLEACRAEWKQATKIWIILLAAAVLLVFDFLYVVKLGKILSIAVGCLIFIWTILFSFVFPFQARFENSLKDTLKNALYLGIKNLPVTLLIVFLNVIPVMCVIAGAFATMMAMPIYLLFGFGFTAMINSFLFNKIFNAFMRQGGHKNEN